MVAAVLEATLARTTLTKSEPTLLEVYSLERRLLIGWVFFYCFEECVAAM